MIHILLTVVKCISKFSELVYILILSVFVMILHRIILEYDVFCDVRDSKSLQRSVVRHTTHRLLVLVEYAYYTWCSMHTQYIYYIHIYVYFCLPFSFVCVLFS